MADTRTYGDPCGVARALDVIGERWALLIVRELLFGPKRFSDLHRGLGGMSQNVLSQRLQELETNGVIRKVRLGPPAATSAYELTERGAALEDVLILLGRWGRERPLPAGGELSTDALMLALKTTFDPSAAADLNVSIDLRLEDDRFRLEVHDGALSIERGAAPQPAIVVQAKEAIARELAFRHRPVRDAIKAGNAEVEGDETLLQRFFDSFP